MTDHEREISRLRVGLRRIATLPESTGLACDAANTAIEIARDLLNEKPGLKVHALKYGAALCSIPGAPCDWPEGHRWLGSNDPDREKITCAECRLALGLGVVE